MEVPTDKPFSEDQARFYFQDLLRGIEYCESSNPPVFLPLGLRLHRVMLRMARFGLHFSWMI